MDPVKKSSPDRADAVAIVDRLRDFEHVLEFLELTGRDGFLDEQGDSWEVFQDLDLDIPSRDGAASEHGRASDDDSPGVFLLGHRTNEFVQVLADPGVLVGGFDETLAFGLENCGSALSCRVYESDDLQPWSEFAKGGRDKIDKCSQQFRLLFETERVVPWALGRTYNILSGL